jgi:hypothetical protein
MVVSDQISPQWRVGSKQGSEFLEVAQKWGGLVVIC